MYRFLVRSHVPEFQRFVHAFAARAHRRVSVGEHHGRRVRIVQMGIPDDERRVHETRFPGVPHLDGSIPARARHQFPVVAVVARGRHGPQPVFGPALYDALVFVPFGHVPDAARPVLRTGQEFFFVPRMPGAASQRRSVSFGAHLCVVKLNH